MTPCFALLFVLLLFGLCIGMAAGHPVFAIFAAIVIWCGVVWTLGDGE